MGQPLDSVTRKERRQIRCRTERRTEQISGLIHHICVCGQGALILGLILRTCQSIPLEDRASAIVWCPKSQNSLQLLDDVGRLAVLVLQVCVDEDFDEVLEVLTQRQGHRVLIVVRWKAKTNKYFQ